MKRLPRQPSRPAANRMLAALGEDCQARLRDALRDVTLDRHRPVLLANQRIGEVTFPDDGVLSLLAALESGATLEVGLVGLDGAIGAQVMFEPAMPCTAEVMVPGYGRALAAEAFRHEMARGGEFAARMMAQANQALAQARILAACNHHHAIQERCARWLLMAHDRLTTDLIAVSHDVLASALGGHRPSISLAQEELRAAGVIEYARGSVRIVDRAGLQRHACECYRALRI